ncbi:MAG: DegV family protein [Candidatus Caccosoma sp.]|nr:DegV family protein [Candidatus Caccosoma sp.]
MKTRDYVIVVDSCSDLSKELRNKNNIEYVKMGVVKKEKTGDVEIPASLDWDLYTNKELNDWQRNGLNMKTTQVSQTEFTTVFEKILKEDKDILYIACSSALSGSFNYSLIVKDELLAKYPNATIICVDSLCSCLGQGTMALDAANMKKEGKTIQEVAAYLEENKLCYNQVATVETLDYLKKAGRVKASAAFFGNIFGVKPMIISDAAGQNFAVKKIKGRKNSLIELVNMLKEVIVEPENQTVYVVHADCLEDANFVKDLIIKEVNPKEVCVEFMGPIIGVSTGPGTIGVYAKGKKVTVVGN